ncbi:MULTISPECIES: hypothetical protein [Clostridia]|uniref:CAAX protease self-immunity n=1 Tax=Ruminococcus hominis TaxID=2763065 RepID=A0ABR7GBT4_9FIRM|nr:MULTISPECIES: hypothetical protein [Clostridia]MBC5684231.1 hypothetical protein [Ruminococcus hominis]MCH4280760.1 hypothetical protein [Mediterraneibacter sp. NSJ-151]
MNTYYATHYFNFKNIGVYLLASLLGLIIVITIVLCIAKLQMHKKLQDDSLTTRKIRRLNREHQAKELTIIESFFEMVFASTSILIFLSLYYILDERIPAVSVYWEKYQDLLLLLFLCFSVILNGWLDIVLVPLEELDSDQKASIRLVSTFYIILILLYIKFIYNDDNYDSLMMYFITLAVGRFIYFDFTMHDFLSTIHGFVQQLPLLILMGAYSGFICWFGFYSGFLLTSNGVIVSTLLAHLFMICSIYILDKTKVFRLLL